MDELAAFRESHRPQRVGSFEYTVGGTGAPLLVLHGGGSAAESAWLFARALEAERRVIAIDWPASVRTVDDVVDGVLAIADAEGCATFALLGFSMGGMLAQALLRKVPRRVTHTILVVSMGPSAAYAKSFAKHRRVLSLVPDALLRWGSKKALGKWLAEGVAVGVAREALDRVVAQRRAQFDDGKVSKASLLADAHVLVDFFSRSYAPLEVPMLIVEAEQDRMVNSDERAALRALYPNARVITLADADHFHAVLAPKSLTDQMLAFLAS